MKKTILLIATIVAAACLSSCKVSVDGGNGGKNDNFTPTVITEVKVPGKTVTGDASNTIWGNEGAFTTARTLDIKSFYMGKYEVTKDEWKAVMKNNEWKVSDDPSYSTSDPDKYKIASGEVDGKRAVEGVTWYDCVYFCNLLSKKEGLPEAYTITDPTVTTDGHITAATVKSVRNSRGYRLPTEVEWEFAARGGDPDADAWNYEYSGASAGSDSALDSVGWYGARKGYGAHQVGKKGENSLKLCDMSGNVWEWCQDVYVDFGTGTYYGSYRVFRGGSWSDVAYLSCVASRCYNYPSYKFYDQGFRVVRNAD